MNEQLLQDLVNQLRELVITLGDTGRSPTAGGDSSKKISDSFDRSTAKIVTAIGKLAAQLDKNTRGKQTEQRSLNQFIKEVDRAASAQEKLAESTNSLVSDIDQEAKARTASTASLAQNTKKTESQLKAESKARLNSFYQEQQASKNYAAIQAEEEDRLARSKNFLKDALQEMGGESLSAQRKMLVAYNALEGLGEVGKSAVKTLKDLGQNGSTSFTQLNGVVDSVTGAITKMAGSLPFVGAAMTALAEGTKFALQSMQQISDNFREVGRVGALGADGMTGFVNASIESGLSQKGLIATINQNATAFSMLGGTVGDGTKQFTKFVGGITKTPLGMQLRNLGLSADDIGESAAAFVTLQARLGATQRMSQDQLTAGTIRYTRELDAISKITGMEKKELQSKMNAALSEQRFRAKMQELERTGQGKVAEQLNLFQAAVGKSAPGLSQGLRDIIAAGGAVTTDAARQAMQATGGQISAIAQKALSGQDIGKSLQELQTSVSAGARRFEKTAQFADLSGVVGNYAELVDFSTTAAGDLGKAMDAARITVSKQAAGQDELTNTVVGAQQQLELASKEAEKFALSMVNVAAPAVAAFTKVLAESAATLNKVLGVGDTTTVEEKRVKAEEANLGAGEFAGMSEQFSGAAPPAPAPKPSVPSGAGATAAPSTGAAAPAPGGSMTQKGLADAGLKLRPRGGDIQKDGEEVSPKLISLAKQIQSSVPGFSYFSGFNDRFHQEKSPESMHTKGLALDFVLSKKPSPKEGQQLASMIQGMGAGKVIDEYNNASAKATGGHMHVSIPEFEKGGIASGPKSGYKAMLHGTEAVVPLPDGKKIPVNMQDSSNNNMSKQIDMMSAQLIRLDEMVSLMRRQVGVSDKMLRVSQS